MHISITIKKYVLTIILFLWAITGIAQQRYITVKGRVTDLNSTPIELVNITLKEHPTIGTTTDKEGHYTLRIPADLQPTLVFTMLGYEPAEYLMKKSSSSTLILNVPLKSTSQDIGEILVTETKRDNGSFVRIDPKLANTIPSITESVEGLIKSQQGVASNNEMSNQYSVRGGNFDENLVYVNGVEIYRPLLIRAGQQEGLSFINPNMVASIDFSAGGFDPKYGDKMSSVLNIKYRTPTQFAATASLSLLGAAVHIEDASKNKRFTHSTGIRYKTNQYLLNSLDEKGDYTPSFIDIQTFLNYRLSDKSDLSFIGNFSRNQYQFIPQSRTTKFGTMNVARMLRVFFEGQEVDEFSTYTGALSFNYHPNTNTNLKMIASVYHASEQEAYDITGAYLFQELDNDPGSNSFGEGTLFLGIGEYQDYARNYLNSTVYSLKHTGTIHSDNHQWQWGIKAQHEEISDRMNEWERRDSADYSLPYSDQTVRLWYATQARHTLSSNRFSGYMQDTYAFDMASGSLSLTGGVRANYWDYNNELIVSPRMAFTWTPDWKKRWNFRLATGFYHQPPFYKELKNLNGEINPNVVAQKSFQVLAGADFLFTVADRPFKLTSSIYYKSLSDLVPYEVENVRIRYLSDQVADGYAAGIDFKINGEFVSGVQSWASLSFLKTEEDIRGDGRGYIPRPTDQRMNFSLFFQDYLPGNPDYKLQLSFHYGSRLPFGPPQSEKWLHQYRQPPYRRVDLGLSKVIVREGKKYPRRSFARHFKDMWIGLELFNLLDIDNTVSYFWVTDINNVEWAVPNYLTGRRVNLKLIAKF